MINDLKMKINKVSNNKCYTADLIVGRGEVQWTFPKAQGMTG